MNHVDLLYGYYQLFGRVFLGEVSTQSQLQVPRSKSQDQRVAVKDPRLGSRVPAPQTLQVRIIVLDDRQRTTVLVRTRTPGS